MRIINPQDATLTNIEVLSFLSSNPPRRPPAAPQGVNPKHFIPSPDLRDHNTVVKEIHNYASRLAPHLLRYPGTSASASITPTPTNNNDDTNDNTYIPPRPETNTPLDDALRELVTRLQPYGLTKGEVLMIVNLGVGVPGAAPAAAEEGVGEGEGQEGENAETMDVDGDEAPPQDAGEGGEVNGDAEAQVNGEEGQEGGEEGEESEVEGEEAGDYGALALIDTVIEEREQRLSDENVLEILAIIRETLGAAST